MSATLAALPSLLATVADVGFNIWFSIGRWVIGAIVAIVVLLIYTRRKGNDPRASLTRPLPPAGAPAAWHPDPYGKTRLRYWDGVRWTEHTAD